MSTSPQAETARAAQAGDLLLVIRTYNTTSVGASSLALARARIDEISDPGPNQATNFGSHASRLDDFHARSPDELSMTKGDRIELIERDEDFNDGWYLGRHTPTGATGLFPLGESTAPFSPFSRSRAYTYTSEERGR